MIFWDLFDSMGVGKWGGGVSLNAGHFVGNSRRC